MSDPPLDRLVRRLAHAWIATGGLWLAAVHELGRLVLASSPLLLRLDLTLALGAAVLLVAATTLALQRQGWLGLGRTATALRVLALLVAVAPLVWRAALAGGSLELLASYVWLPVCGAALIAVVPLAWLDICRPALTLGVVEVWLRPTTLLLWIVVFGLGAVAVGHVGFERTLPLLGLLLATAAAPTEAFVASVYGRSPETWRWERSADAGVVLACLALLAFTPASRAPGLRASLDATPVYAAKDRYQGLEITTAQDQSQWFVDGELKHSSLDHYRYYESLVHPALAHAPRLTRIVAFGSGLGLLEREVLRYPEVARLEVVMEDNLGPSAYADLAWLRDASHHALEDERTVLIRSEVSAWLAGKGPRYDGAIIDMPDPGSDYWGKYYTRFFFKMLEARLTPDAVVAMQVTASENVATILWQSARSAGWHGRMLRVPVPSMGEWHVLLASRRPLPEQPRRPLPHSLRFLDSRVLATLYYTPPSAPRPEAMPVSLLHDPAAFERFIGEVR